VWIKRTWVTSIAGESAMWSDESPSSGYTDTQASFGSISRVTPASAVNRRR
jgi:hypothetical protein